MCAKILRTFKTNFYIKCLAEWDKYMQESTLHLLHMLSSPWLDCELGGLSLFDEVSIWPVWKVDRNSQHFKNVCLGSQYSSIEIEISQSCLDANVDWGFLHAGQDPDVVRDPAYLIPFPRQVLVLNTDLSQPWIPSSYC